MKQQLLQPHHQEKIKVCIRLRPLLAPYEDEDAWRVDSTNHRIFSLNSTLSSSFDPMALAMNQQMNGQQVSINAFIREKELRRRYQDAAQSQSFSFDNVFGPDSKTPQIYNAVVRPITRAAMQGYNGTVFLYGQTTSGKTYTMLGTPEIPGVLPCAVRDIFQAIKQESNIDYRVWVSYLEIYNESINDLLAQPNNSGKPSTLKVKDDPHMGVDVAGLLKQQVFTFEEAILLLRVGEEQRVYKETSIHEHSSRSHTIFRVHIESSLGQYSTLNLVDLAGSERLNEFQAAQGSLGETGYINKSLFVLSNVINKLAEGRSQHVPYRDSKLTRILQQALGGNSLTAIVCTVSPASINYYQTLSTLRFATRAKIVKNKPIINEVNDGAASHTDGEAAFQQFQIEIDKLRGEIAVKDSQLIKFQEYHQILQNNLMNQEKEMKEKLMSEIKSTYREFENQDQEFDLLKQRLEQEQFEKNQLLSELENVKSSQGNTERKQDNQKHFHTNFIEGLASQVESFVSANNNKSLGSSQKIQPLSANMQWQIEVSKLSTIYRQEIHNLQNQMRKQMQQLISSFYMEDEELRDAIIENCLQQQSSPLKDLCNDQQYYTNAQRVLNDIEQEKVFDDIVVEFDQIIQGGFENLGYNIDQLINNMVLPSFEDAESVAEDLKQYYMQLIRVSQKRYDEVKMILENFYRHLIIQKREQLEYKHQTDTLNEADFEAEKLTFARIAEHHNEKLTRMRECFDFFNQTIDNQFDDVMRKLRQWSGYGEEDRLNFQDSGSFRTSDHGSSLVSLQPSDVKSSLVPETLDREGHMRLDSRGSNQKQLLRPNVQNQQTANAIQSQSTSLQEEPPEIKSIIFQSHDIVSPTPKFQFANKHQNQTGPSFYEKENLNQEYSALMKQVTPQTGNIKTLISSKKLQNTNSQTLLPKLILAENLLKSTPKQALKIQLSLGNKVYMWGSGKDGRCGNGKEQNEKVPVAVSSTHKFIQLSSGYHHSAAVSKDGMVLTWGRGIFGQLGHGDTENYSLPTPVESLLKIQIGQVVCGWQHTMALSLQGRVFSWGYGEDGQLGHGDTNDQSLPKEIDFFKRNGIKVAMIAAGHSHSGCITESTPSRLFMWGCNPDCRLMTDENENKFIPSLTLIEKLREAKAFDSKQSINSPTSSLEFETESYEPCYLSLGVTHSAVITRNGEVYTGGSKMDGQLGLSYMKSGSFASSTADNLMNQRQYREGTDLKDISMPLFLVEGFGNHYENKAIQVSCGDSYTLVLTEKHHIYSFGKTSHGRLGFKSTQDYVSEPTMIDSLRNENIVQISAGCRHAACVTDTGKLYSWGFNFYEQLGLGDSEKDFDVPTRVQKNLFSQKVKQVSCGYFHTGALIANVE